VEVLVAVDTPFGLGFPLGLHDHVVQDHKRLKDHDNGLEIVQPDGLVDKGETLLEDAEATLDVLAAGLLGLRKLC